MKKAIVVVVMASLVALATVGVVATVSAATGGSHHRQAAKVHALPGLDPALTARAKCRTLVCINQTLRGLVRAVTRCEKVIEVGRFPDYQSTTPGVATSGLDLADNGSYKVVIDVC